MILKAIEYKNKWMNSAEYKPVDFDMVMLKLSTGRIIPGWWSGMSWDGSRLKVGDQVVAFRSYFGNSCTFWD
jgi:hypothetical protein